MGAPLLSGDAARDISLPISRDRQFGHGGCFLILESIITTTCEWRDSRPSGWVAAAAAAVLQWPFRIRRMVIPPDNVKTKHAGHLTNLCIEQIDADLEVSLEEIPDNDFRMTMRNQ